MAEGWITRLKNMPNTPGQWGKFLGSILMLGWGLNLVLDGNNMMQWQAILRVGDTIGITPLGWWMMTISIVPIFGVVSNWIWLALVGDGLVFVTWLTFCYSALITETFGKGGIWVCLVGALASLNSEYQLVRRVYLKRR